MSRYSSKDILEILRKHGVVVTPHRYKMMEYLNDLESSDDFEDDCEDGDADWFRASWIYYSLLEEGYFISLSSVYKNLCLFRSMGLINPDGRVL